MRKTTADIMVDALVAHGVDTMFGIPGAHCYELSDALARRSNDIRFVHSRHEQGSGYMAYGYAKSTGKPGVFSVVPGPGVLNAGAALCTAYGGNAPVMCLTGNIMSHLIGQGRGQLHELPDQLATLRGLTKWTERIDHPSGVASYGQHIQCEIIRVELPPARRWPMRKLNRKLNIKSNIKLLSKSKIK